MKDCKCTFLVGPIYMAPKPDVCPNPLDLSQYGLMNIGTATQLTRNMSFTEITVANLQTPALGNACQKQILDSEEVEIVLNCIDKKNLLLALGGTSDDVLSSTITEESHTLGLEVECVFVPTEFLIDVSQPVIVTDDTLPTPVTYVLGDDYFVRSSGIELTQNTSVPPSSVLLVSYESLDQTLFNTSSTTGGNYILHFDGNDATTGEPLSFTYYNLKFDPTDTISFLNDGAFLTLTVTGEALLSPCHFDTNGNALRSFFKKAD